MSQSECANLAPSPAAAAACCCVASTASTSRGAPPAVMLHVGLLRALRRIRDAPLATLLAPSAVADAVREIGIQPTKAMARAFASDRKFFLDVALGAQAAGVLRDSFGLPAMGMWQVPDQFECLVKHLAATLGGEGGGSSSSSSTTTTSRRRRRSVTVGTWSGWTDITLAAYLQRLSPVVHAGLRDGRGAQGWEHATFDVRDYLSPCVASLLAHYNVSHVRGGWVRVMWGLQPEPLRSLCVMGSRLECDGSSSYITSSRPPPPCC
jgi:hypothetical protein